MNDFRREFSQLSKIAWPLLLAQLMQTMMGVSDTIMAGRYDSLDMASVAIGHSVVMPILIFMQGVCLALSPIVARFHGAKEPHQVAYPVWQTLYLSLSIAALVMLSIFVMPNLLHLLEMDAQMRSETLEYVSFVLMSAPAFAIYQTLRNYCEGLSKTRPTMVIMFAGLMVNIPANYIFINGLYGMPEMGGAGCGLATMLVFYVMAFATWVYTLIAKSLSSYALYTHISWPDIKFMGAVAKQGVPIALTFLAEVSLFAVVAILLAPLGYLTVASHQVALNFSSLIFMIPLSIGLAVAIRIGHVIGEQRTPMAKTAYHAALVLAISSVTVTATGTIFGSHAIASLYSNETAVIEYASALLLFAAVFQFSDAIQVVSANALRGYKDTQAMLIISVFCYWVIGFPTGILLGLSDLIVPAMAAKGFWIGFIVGLSSAAILMTLRVRVVQARLARLAP
ncbi:MATE family efflux transporter [Glaciecola siphonariae]|uniref:Multidrug-efflux transporter n=1 Tax=Glaciecola siphonariae TaxID=521012 RepID=A0ABV9LUZ4_9ALTE